MRVLFLGDVMGRSGRDAVKANLKNLKKSLSLDFVIVNAENATAGFGLSIDHANDHSIPHVWRIPIVGLWGILQLAETVNSDYYCPLRPKPQAIAGPLELQGIPCNSRGAQLPAVFGISWNSKKSRLHKILQLAETPNSVYYSPLRPHRGALSRAAVRVPQYQ